MKKVLAILAALALIGSAAVAEVDLSGLTNEELVGVIRNALDLLWKSEDWECVRVPQGTYKIGEEIPAGHWTISAAGNASVMLYLCTKLNDVGDVDFSGRVVTQAIKGQKNSSYNSSTDIYACDFDLKEGQYLIIKFGNVEFIPYTSKAGLGFKKK